MQLKGIIHRCSLLVLALLVGVSLSGCVTYTLNNMAKAKKGIDKYYLTIEQQRYDDALNFYSPRYFESSSIDTLRAMLDNVKTIAGQHEDHQLVQWRAAFSNKNDSAIQLLYRVTYSHGQTLESLLVSPKGKIHGHEIRFIDEFGNEMKLMEI
ncbi:MAG: hypothetical protein COB04_00385 [Gammaproteobacteria bacterium]|nr:MAG: hypothetical protein COB04_00385 [Gammaproteobacteria bacterium]